MMMKATFVVALLLGGVSAIDRCSQYSKDCVTCLDITNPDGIGGRDHW